MIDPITAVSTVGFPIAVTCYLLIRFEKKMGQNTKAITDLIFYLKGKR